MSDMAYGLAERASSAAYPSAAGSRSSGSTSRLTSPIAWASGPVIRREESSRSAALPWPTSRGRIQETPSSATRPRALKAAANLACGTENRTSHISAWLNPMPAQAPLTAATTGLGNDMGRVRGGSRSVGHGRAPEDAPSSTLMSIPGQKLRPAPVRTTARTRVSASARSNSSL